MFVLAILVIKDHILKIQFITELNRIMTTKHHYTLPYTPWSNGTVEVVNKEIRRLLKVWVSEFRIELKQWPSLISLMVHVLNFSVSPTLGYPPAMIFGGFSTITNVESIFVPSKYPEFRNSRMNFKQLSESVKALRESLDNLHKEVQVNSTRRGNYNIPRNAVNFDIGDFVMYATRKTQQGIPNKSRPRWTGPYRVIAVNSDWDFTIEHLVTGENFHAHSSRLKFYCDDSLEVDADLKFQITHDEMRYKVDRIIDHRKEEGVFYLKVVWQGFDDEDSTWEPFNILFEAVPDMVRNYAQGIPELENRCR